MPASQAYHIRTEEQRSPGLCLDIRTLDSLLVCDKWPMLLGYTPKPENKRLGEIWCYPVPSSAYDRVMALIHGRTSYEGQALRGEIIKELLLDPDRVERIQRNYRPNFRECEPIYNVTRRVELPWDYEGSTKQLLAILSNDFKGNRGKRKRVEKYSIQRIPVLQPIPSF
ncbi:MAG: hypothetical protein NT129_03560 [Candidatus Aenigmarchaeota archaeon]|nr:hypothetical protein [Candidatus Aenigmarchaeota archaeon]